MKIRQADAGQKLRRLSIQWAVHGMLTNAATDAMNKRAVAAMYHNLAGTLRYSNNRKGFNAYDPHSHSYT